MTKEKRFRLNYQQREILWEIFFQNKKPSRIIKESISEKYNIPFSFIQNWFRNARATFKLRYEKEIKQIDDLILIPNCNALCIQPTMMNVQKYLYVRTKEKENDLVIYSKYCRELGVYSLGYW